jgi:Ca2+-transporting ATPase
VNNPIGPTAGFNEFNARKPDEFNVFKGITKNKLFIGIVGITVVLQVRLV